MSALPSPASVAAPRRLVVPAALVTCGRTAAMLALALLVPGEAARIGADLHRRD